MKRVTCRRAHVIVLCTYWMRAIWNSWQIRLPPSHLKSRDRKSIGRDCLSLRLSIGYLLFSLSLATFNLCLLFLFWMLCLLCLSSYCSVLTHQICPTQWSWVWKRIVEFQAWQQNTDCHTSVGSSEVCFGNSFPSLKTWIWQRSSWCHENDYFFLFWYISTTHWIIFSSRARHAYQEVELSHVTAVFGLSDTFLRLAESLSPPQFIELTK